MCVSSTISENFVNPRRKFHQSLRKSFANHYQRALSIIMREFHESRERVLYPLREGIAMCDICNNVRCLESIKPERRSISIMREKTLKDRRNCKSETYQSLKNTSQGQLSFENQKMMRVNENLFGKNANERMI